MLVAWCLLRKTSWQRKKSLALRPGAACSAELCALMFTPRRATKEAVHCTSK